MNFISFASFSEEARILNFFIGLLSLIITSAGVADTAADVYVNPEKYNRTYLSAPVTTKGICVGESEWTHKTSGEKFHAAEACPKFEDGTCTPDPLECAQLSKRHRYQASRYSIPNRLWANDGGVDKYNRKVENNPHEREPLAKHTAYIYSVNLESGKYFTFCVFYHSSEPAEGYNSKLDPKKPITVCKAPAKDYVDARGNTPINPKTSRPYQAPECPPLLECIERDIPLANVRLAERKNVPDLKVVPASPEK